MCSDVSTLSRIWFLILCILCYSHDLVIAISHNCYHYSRRPVFWNLQDQTGAKTLDQLTPLSVSISSHPFSALPIPFPCFPSFAILFLSIPYNPFPSPSVNSLPLPFSILSIPITPFPSPSLSHPCPTFPYPFTPSHPFTVPSPHLSFFPVPSHAFLVLPSLQFLQ